MDVKGRQKTAELHLSAKFHRKMALETFERHPNSPKWLTEPRWSHFDLYLHLIALFHQFSVVSELLRLSKKQNHPLLTLPEPSDCFGPFPIVRQPCFPISHPLFHSRAQQALSIVNTPFIYARAITAHNTSVHITHKSIFSPYQITAKFFV